MTNEHNPFTDAEIEALAEELIGDIEAVPRIALARSILNQRTASGRAAMDGVKALCGWSIEEIRTGKRAA